MRRRSDGGDGDGEDGERTRFPFLALLRGLVAFVVTALAVVVVVTVIIVLHRPEKIDLKSYRYVQSQDQWWNYSTIHAQPVGGGASIGAGDGSNGKQNQAAVLAVAPKDQQAGETDPVMSTAAPVAQVRIMIMFFAYNPSGRGKVDFNITSITVADLAAADSDNSMPFRMNMTKIKTVSFLPPDQPDPLMFSLPAQTMFMRRTPVVKIDDREVLSYLAAKHGFETKFRVMTQVNVTYMHSANKINATFYCWPVFFVYGTPADQLPADEVLCETADQFDHVVFLHPAS